jgi:hypothetical protein
MFFLSPKGAGWFETLGTDQEILGIPPIVVSLIEVHCEAIRPDGWSGVLKSATSFLV